MISKRGWYGERGIIDIWAPARADRMSKGQIILPPDSPHQVLDLYFALSNPDVLTPFTLEEFLFHKSAECRHDCTVISKPQVCVGKDRVDAPATPASWELGNDQRDRPS